MVESLVLAISCLYCETCDHLWTFLLEEKPSLAVSWGHGGEEIGAEEENGEDSGEEEDPGDGGEVIGGEGVEEDTGVENVDTGHGNTCLCHF